MKEGQDVGRAEDNVEVLQQQLNELNAEIEAQSQELTSAVDPQTEVFDTVTIKPKKDQHRRAVVHAGVGAVLEGCTGDDHTRVGVKGNRSDGSTDDMDSTDYPEKLVS